MLTSFSLSPTDSQFYDIEDFCRLLPSPLTEAPMLSADVDDELYTSLLQLMSCLRVPQLDPHIGWDTGLKQVQFSLVWTVSSVCLSVCLSGLSVYFSVGVSGLVIHVTATANIVSACETYLLTYSMLCGLLV